MKKFLVVMTLLSSVLAFAKNDETYVACYEPNGTTMYFSSDKIIGQGVPQVLDVTTDGVEVLFEGEVVEVSNGNYKAKDNSGNIIFSLEISESAAYEDEGISYFDAVLEFKGSYPRQMICAVVPDNT